MEIVEVTVRYFCTMQNISIFEHCILFESAPKVLAWRLSTHVVINNLPVTLYHLIPNTIIGKIFIFCWMLDGEIDH